MAKTNSPATTTDLPTPETPGINSTDDTDARFTDDDLCHLVQQLGSPFVTIPTIQKQTGYTYEHTCHRLRALAENNRLTRVNTNPHNRAYYALGQIDPSEFNEDEHISSTGNIDVSSPRTPDTVQNTLSSRTTKYEQYWRAVDAYRFLDPTLLASDATKNDTETSPLAAAYITARDRRNELREECRDLPGSLPEYRDKFDTPQFDYRHPTPDEIEQADITLEDTDDPIYLPEDFTTPAVWAEAHTDSDPSAPTGNEPNSNAEQEPPETNTSDNTTSEHVETISLSLNIELSIEVPANADISIDDININ